jgi:hypothetical protein
MQRHDALYERMEEMRNGVKRAFCRCDGRRNSNCAVAGSGLHPSFWNEPKNFEALYLLDK